MLTWGKGSGCGSLAEAGPEMVRILVRRAPAARYQRPLRTPGIWGQAGVGCDAYSELVVLVELTDPATGRHDRPVAGASLGCSM